VQIAADEEKTSIESSKLLDIIKKLITAAMLALNSRSLTSWVE